jgi:hypothetical protein
MICLLDNVEELIKLSLKKSTEQLQKFAGFHGYIGLQDCLVQWYLPRADTQMNVKIVLFVNGFVVYH